MPVQFPVLKKFLDNPSYCDTERYGSQWNDKRRYEARWDYMKKICKTLPITYFKESPFSYYLHILFPSERRGNTYDIVIHFFTEDEYVVNESSLANYNIQIFSNNPVFGYHFAHANYIKGILIPFLAEKFQPAMIEDRAVKYNPKDAIGYCHSFYEAGRYLLENPRTINKSFIESKCLAFSANVISRMCRHIDRTIEEYNNIKSKEANQKRFGKASTTAISDAIDDAMSSIKQTADKLGTSGSKALDKIKGSLHVGDKNGTSGVRRITAKKSITSSGKSAVRKIKPKKKI